MKRFWLYVVLTALVGGATLPALPLDVKIEAPATAAPGDLVILSAKAEGALNYSWILANSDKTFLPVENGTKAVFASGAAGKYIFVLSASDATTLGSVKHVLTIGQPEPEPDPDPPPPPPPPPPPDPDPAPIPADGFRVLIVYESGDMTKYPIETQMILTGADVREFLKSNCVNEGGTPGFRIYDPDVNIGGDLEVWKQAITRPRTAIPWVVISNGKTGFEGPLPKTPTEFLDLCKKYLAK